MCTNVNTYKRKKIQSINAVKKNGKKKQNEFEQNEVTLKNLKLLDEKKKIREKLLLFQ